MLVLTVALVIAVDRLFFEVYRHEPDARREAGTAIPTKYHYSEGGHLLADYDGFIDAPIPTTLPAH